MIKDLLRYLFVSWLGYLIFLLLGVGIIELYYPVHSWLFTGEWRWDSFERSMRFYKACVPASFGVALILTFNEWLEMKDKTKKSDEKPQK
jgi:hypothetical protein